MTPMKYKPYPHNQFAFGASAFGLALVAILALFAACLFSGCSVLAPFKPVIPSRSTNTVVSPVLSPIERIEWRTNTVTITNVLPGEVLVVTNVQAATPIIVVTNEVVWVTNQVVATNGYIVNPEFTGAVENARRINSAVNPTPTAPMVDWGLSLVTLAATAAAAWKTRSANKADALREKAEVIQDTLIRAVETAPPTIGAIIKRHVAGVADLRGVSGELDSAVQRVTAAMADGHMSAEEFWELAQDPKVTVDMIPEPMRAAFLKLRG